MAVPKVWKVLLKFDAGGDVVASDLIFEGDRPLLVWEWTRDGADDDWRAVTIPLEPEHLHDIRDRMPGYDYLYSQPVQAPGSDGAMLTGAH